MELVTTVSLIENPKGRYRITLPKKIVVDMNLKPGDKLLIYYNKQNKKIIITKG